MIKKETQLYGVQPEMVLCHIEIKSIFESMGFECIVTSVVGKVHKKGSLHYPGYAIDYRTKHIVNAMIGKNRWIRIDELVKKLKDNLPQCDFIFESKGKLQEHIHAEYDPKSDLKFQKAKSLYKLNGEWSR